MIFSRWLLFQAEDGIRDIGVTGVQTCALPIYVHLHPGMLVALHWKHDFFASEILFDCGGRGRLRLVPLAVVFRCGMDVVRGLIVIFDLDGLTGHHAHHVGMVLATALVEDHGVFGYVERTTAESIFYID